MKRIVSYLRWAALAFLVLILVVVVGGVLFTRTERFRVLLHDQLVSALNASFRGDVSVERIEGSIWRNVTLHNFTIQYQGADILYVPHLTVQYSLLPLLRGRVEGAGEAARRRCDARVTKRPPRQSSTISWPRCPDGSTLRPTRCWRAGAPGTH